MSLGCAPKRREQGCTAVSPSRVETLFKVKQLITVLSENINIGGKIAQNNRKKIKIVEKMTITAAIIVHAVSSDSSAFQYLNVGAKVEATSRMVDCVLIKEE